jgi:hypothetical protein
MGPTLRILAPPFFPSSMVVAIKTSVLDPIGCNVDKDSDFYLNADPDLDPDPGSQTSAIQADPDPCQAFKSQKVEILHEKYRSKNILMNVLKPL